MDESEAGAASRRSRRRWSTSEKRRIVELTMAPMASVSEVARACNAPNLLSISFSRPLVALGA
jgi:transposase-like protein